MMEFIQRVSVVDEFERPDAAECLRILMKVLFDIPVDDAGRVNCLTEKVMEVVDDLSTPADELALLVECLYVSLSCMFSCVCFGVRRFILCPSCKSLLGILCFNRIPREHCNDCTENRGNKLLNSGMILLLNELSSTLPTSASNHIDNNEQHAKRNYSVQAKEAERHQQRLFHGKPDEVGR